MHTPDLFDGRTFDDVESGVGYAQEVGFDEVRARGIRAAADLPASVVYAGFSLGVVSAQRLAQTREGAAGAVLMESCVPATSSASAGRPGSPCRCTAWTPTSSSSATATSSTPGRSSRRPTGASCSSTPATATSSRTPASASYDAEAAALLLERVLGFLDSVG